MRFRCELTGVESINPRSRVAFFQTRPRAEEWAKAMMETITDEKEKESAVITVFITWQSAHLRITSKGTERFKIDSNEAKAVAAREARDVNPKP